MNFFQALWHFEFLQLVALAGLVAAISSGVIGSLVVVKRIAFMAGGIAHAVLGGMGVAHYLGESPLIGAFISAIFAALLIGWVQIKYQQREDMLIGAVWAVGMAIGILAIAKTPGYSTHLMSYLLGNLLLVSRDQVMMMVGLNLLMLLLLALVYRPLMATLADEEFARLRGVKTHLLYLGLLVMIALATVILVHSVGLILVMALLTLPAATGLMLASTLGRLMLVATLLSGLSIFGGLAVAYETDSPTGAVIVLLAAAIYLAVLLVRSKFKKAI